MAKLDVQNRVVDLIDQVSRATVSRETVPPWLLRPGRLEAGPLWPSIQAIYKDLTGLVLPDVMRPVESRRVDAILTGPDGAPRIVEVDEDQHFSPHRAKAFTLYPAHISVAFDRETWIERSLSGMKPKGGNFAKPCPPLFPEAGGRHIQRAFRDALADLLPAAHGWAPTLRVGEFEVAGWLHDDDAADRMSALLDRKVVSR